MRYGCNWRRLPAQAGFENVGIAEGYLLRASGAIEGVMRSFVLINVASSSTRITFCSAVAPSTANSAV
jgi:hypothetical protein